MQEELAAIGVFPFLIGRREVVANVTGGDSAQNGICGGVPANVRIRMSNEALRVRNLCAAQGNMIAGAEFVDIVSGSDAGRITCLLYTSPSPRDQRGSRMPSSA